MIASFPWPVLSFFRFVRSRSHSGNDEAEGLSQTQIALIMQGIYTRGDRIMTRFILIHAAIALGLAFFYQTWLITLVVSSAAAALFLVSAALMPRSFLTRCLAGVSLQTFVILHIYQMHGLAEMHFFFFTACTMMIVYQDWRCLWPGTALIVGQHTLFALLTNAGQNLYFFEDSYIATTKLIFHFGIVAAQVVICGYWAYLLRRRTFEQVRQTRQDVQQEQLQQSLIEAEARADADSLTGLLNHRAFHRRLEEEAERTQREGGSLAVAVLDLNNFKFFNDAYGHLAGDAVLRQVAAALRNVSRPDDCLARYGGDEFTLLAPGVGPEGAREFSERLHHCLDACGYQPDDDATLIPLTFSVGLAFFPQDGPTRLDTLSAADARLMREKSGEEEDDAESDRHRAALASSLEGFSMLDALVTAVDNKDRYTLRHSEDVLKYSLEVARGLGLDERTQRTLKTAALLHDVGKIGVPDRILRKPGKLTEGEYAAIQHHAMMGAVIVGAVPGLEATLDAIRHHHERWDGEGYPFGLKGEETPLLARIMAVADAFSAMTTDRPYRKGMNPGKAESILQGGAGTQWDAHCVQAFLAERSEKLLRLPLGGGAEENFHATNLRRPLRLITTASALRPDKTSKNALIWPQLWSIACSFPLPAVIDFYSRL